MKLKLGLFILLAFLNSCADGGGASLGGEKNVYEENGGKYQDAYMDLTSYEIGSDYSYGTGYDIKPDLPPEKEKELDLKAPEGSENFVYIANSSSDSVIKIDAKTQDVTLIEVGDNPTILKTIPKNDAAVVLNQ
ncbi:MAG: hypothetical protein FJ088_15465, partial [Deltaproteobacteria bacterium]|nr:hypothetical protein [Deltaproteobacteria bacterium]